MVVLVMISVVLLILFIFLASISFNNGDTSMGGLYSVISVALVIFLIVLCFIPSNPKSGGPDKYDIIAIAENEVESRLKSPSTAKFSSAGQTTVENNGDVWTVDGWVDAQNSFGATLRSNYSVQITFVADDRYRIDYCYIN